MAERTPEIFTGFVSSDGEAIYYESTGEGEAILFCHGLGGNHANWFQQVPFHLIGQSMGGWAAVGFALAYPEWVRSLVLTDTLGGIYTEKSGREFAALVEQAATLPPARPRLAYHPALGRGFSQQDSVRGYLYQQLGSFGQPPPAL